MVGDETDVLDLGSHSVETVDLDVAVPNRQQQI